MSSPAFTASTSADSSRTSSTRARRHAYPPTSTGHADHGVPTVLGWGANRGEPSRADMGPQRASPTFEYLLDLLSSNMRQHRSTI